MAATLHADVQEWMMKPTPRNSTSSLPDSKRSELLDQLDGKLSTSARRSVGRGRDRRIDPRWEFRSQNVALRVEHLGGGVSHLLVCGRNLSSGGIGFLHGGYLHPGSHCQFDLITTTGETDVVIGHVVSCRHVEGVVHEVGVQFERRIDAERFVDEAAQASDAVVDTIDVPKLHGRLLYVEDMQAESALMMHFLRPTGLHVVNVKSPGAALDAIKRGSFDFVFTDMYLDGEDGIEGIRKMRELNFTGPIVLVTAETDEARLQTARDAGADAQLLLPYTPDALYELLAELEQSISGVEGGTLYSDCAGDPTMMTLVTQFIREARRCSTKLEEALDHQHLDDARTLCVQLRGSAPAYGFAPVGDAASMALRMLDEQETGEEVSRQIRRLILLCQSLAVRATDTR